MADDDPGRLSLAFQDLEAVPDQVAEAKGPSTTELDLTENALQCVDVAYPVLDLVLIFARCTEILGTW